MKKQYKHKKKPTTKHYSARQKSNPHFYSKLIGLVSTFLLITLLSANAIAQTTYPIEHQPWTFILEEESKSLEASFQVVQCDATSSSKINIMVFNEKGTSDTTGISVTIYKEDMSDSTSSSLTLYLNPGDMLMPDCGSSVNNNLSFTLPTGYDPEELTVKVEFN